MTVQFVKGGSAYMRSDSRVLPAIGTGLRGTCSACCISQTRLSFVSASHIGAGADVIGASERIYASSAACAGDAPRANAASREEITRARMIRSIQRLFEALLQLGHAFGGDDEIGVGEAAQRRQRHATRH